MKFYVSTTALSNSGSAGKGSPTTATRRISSRTLLLVVLVLGIFLPFLFLRIAFLMLESATACSSPLEIVQHGFREGCIRWRFLSGADSSPLREELSRALVEAKEGNIDEEGIQSFNELVKDFTSRRGDIKAFAFKTKATLLQMEREVQSARQHNSISWHLASRGIPRSLHCLSLNLAEEYTVNSRARSCLPPPEYLSRLSDPSCFHLVLLTDNVLAASTVVSSTLQNSANPGKLVFHIVTDKKTYNAMHAWFAMDSTKSAVVEVKGLHQYDWSEEVNVGVKEMLEIQRLIWMQYYNNLKEDLVYEREHKRHLEGLSPSSLSLLNQLRIYIPELFPDLNKIVFLEDDIVVQHDISPLWELDLNGKVVGAVVSSWCGDDCCPGRKYEDYLNFSHPLISSNFDRDRCAWLYGMNVFDIAAWRRSNITATYHHWLKLSLNYGLELWHPGVLPPSLIAFEGHVHPIDPKWHLAGLGYQPIEVHHQILETAAVIHFSGPAKPWLEIGFPEVRGLWKKYVSESNSFIRKCEVME